MFSLSEHETSLADVREVGVDAAGPWAQTTGGRVRLDARGNVVAVDRAARPSAGPPGLVEALTWRGVRVEAWIDGRLSVGGKVWALPGPPVDLAVVGAELRVACVLAAVRLDETLTVLPIPATAAGPVWGTAEGTLLDDAGGVVGAVPAGVTGLVPLADGWLVGTSAGLYRVNDALTRVDPPGICGNFITGVTVWQGRRVVGTFDQGACVETATGWEALDLPSTMVNDVLAVGDTLWIATAEGLVEIGPTGRTVYGEVQDDPAPGAPGLNHPGANALAFDGTALWVADVLGPVRVHPAGWRRYRWQVTGHSYQAIAACDGRVWAGSEDDGLAVRGVSFGRANGDTTWRHVSVLDGLPEDWVMAVACGSDASAWVGTYRSGVGRIDADGWHPVAGLEQAWVQALLLDGETLWVGTADGLYRVDDMGVTRLSTDDVWSLARDADTLLVGTRAGLAVLDL